MSFLKFLIGMVLGMSGLTVLGVYALISVGIDGAPLYNLWSILILVGMAWMGTAMMFHEIGYMDGWRARKDEEFKRLYGFNPND